MKLANRLRESGVDARIERHYSQSLYGFTPPDPQPHGDAWTAWQDEQIRDADRVLLVCDQAYASSPEGSGVSTDLAFMEADLADRHSPLRKFIPVGFAAHSKNAAFIPPFLRGAYYYDLSAGTTGFEDLVRRFRVEFPIAQKTDVGKAPVTAIGSDIDPWRAPHSSDAEHRANTALGAHMSSESIPVSSVKGRIGAAIITIRHDEYDAVEERLERTIPIEGGNNSYEFAELTDEKGRTVPIALTRCVGQGNLTAQAVANNIIQDLDPAWLMVVGIAGGVPDNEFGLGDVILASALHDFSFGAATPGSSTYQSGGGPMHADVVRFLQTKIGGKNRERLRNLAGFTNEARFLAHPLVFSSQEDLARRLYGEDDYRNKVADSVTRHFPDGQRKRGVGIWSGPCANGNVLVKDPALLATWQQSARQIVDVETELAGVYEAARSAGRQNYPILAVRGLSDIVGLKRDPDWTGYACLTAAAFACAILRSSFIDFTKNLPNPR